MDYSINKISQFDIKGQKKRENWFLKTAFKISILTGAAIVYFKIKGPVKDTLSNVLKNQISVIQKRAEYKSSVSKFFGDEGFNKSKYYTYSKPSDLELANTTIRNQYGKNRSERKVLSTLTLQEIEENEKGILRQIDSDVLKYYNYSLKKWPTLDIFKKYSKISTDEMYFELRKITLTDFLTHNNVIGSDDYELLKKLNDSTNIKDREKLRTLHELYLREDADYASKYRKELTRFERNYLLEKHKKIRPSIPSYNKAKIMGMGPIIERITPEESLQMRLDSGHKVNVFRSEEQLWDMLQGNQKNKITSSSLVGEMDYIKGDVFKIASKFDYTSDIKKLIETVRSIDKDKYGFANLTVNIIQKGTGSDPVYYLKITGTHVKLKGEQSIEIPIAQNGFVPASNAYGRQRHDYVEPKVFGKVSKLHSDFRNSTQLGIRQVIRALKSNLMNSFMTEPGEVFHRMKSALDFVLEPSARMENTARDATTGLLIINKDRRLENKLLFNRSFESIDMLRTIARHRKQGGINITIDLETLSPTRTGPNVQATDAHTQITQAGFSVAELDRTGAYHIQDIQNFYSDHAIKMLENIEVTRERANWLLEYLPENEKLQLAEASPNEIWKAWCRYQKTIAQGKFANNHDIARHTLKQINKLIDANPNKPIYITTKFGTGFDLKILGIWAPDEYNQLMKKAKHLDIHGVSHLENFILGSDESIAQTEILKQMMNHYGLPNYDLTKKDHIIKLMENLQSKGHIVMSTKLHNQLRQYSNMMAHDAGTDAMLAHLLVGFNINKYLGDQMKLDTDYEELKNIFHNMHRFKTIDEQWDAATSRERVSAFGHVTSAMGLSQGLIAKQFSSLIQTRHFLITPDVPVNKQWNQMLNGFSVILGNKGSQEIKDHIRKTGSSKDIKKLIRKFKLPSVMSQGDLDAISYFRKADAEKRLFSHTLNVKYFAVLGGFGQMEGVHHLSADVLEKTNLKYTEKLNLSEVAGMCDDPSLSTQLRKLYNDIENKAKELANTEGQPLSIRHYDLAAMKVSAGKLPVIPKSTRMLASAGSQGSITFKTPVDGIIRNIHVDYDNEKLKVFADTEFIINSQSSDLPWVSRGLAGKAITVIDEAVTRGMMYGGVEGYGPASFLEKNYVGSLKAISIRKSFDELFDKLENGTPDQKAKAKKKIQYWAGELNMRWNQDINMMIHDSYKDGNFANIKKMIIDKGQNLINPQWNDANKFLGNIDMNLEKFQAMMIDTGQVWTKDEVRNWYRVFGSTVEKGRVNAQKFYESQLKKLQDQFLKPEKELLEVFGQIDKSVLGNELKIATRLLKQFILPGYDENGRYNEELIASGKVAKLFEARRRMTGGLGPEIWEPGIFFNEAFNKYSFMNGTHGRSTQLKLRRSLLGQVEDFKHLTPTTRDLLHNARSGYLGNKGAGFMKAREGFFNAMLSNLTVTDHLTKEEINTILDIKHGININNLKIHNLDPVQKAELLKHFEDIDEHLGDGANRKQIILDMLDSFDNERFTKLMKDPQNRTLISLDAAQKIISLTRKKKIRDENFKTVIKDAPLGFYSLSINPEMEKHRVMEFDLKNILNTFTDEMKFAQKIPSVNVLTNMFSEIAEKASNFLEVDTKNNTLKIKNFILRAPQHIENVINLVTKGGTEKIGYVTQEKIQSDEVLRAYQIFQDTMKLGEPNKIEASKSLLQKQYLTYLLRQFIDVEEDMIEPFGFVAKSIDSNNMFIKLQDLRRNMGGKFDWKQMIGSNYDTETITSLNQWSERVLGDFRMSDVFVHENFYKENMDYNTKENSQLRSRKHWESVKDKFGTVKEAEKFIRENALYGATVRYPISPAGTIPMLESRFNIVPKEIAGFLGVNTNVMALCTEFYKWIGGDNDGDSVYGIIHGYDTVKNINSAMSQLKEQHAATFEELLNSNISDKQNGQYKIRKFRDVLKEKKYFAGHNIINGTLKVGSFDEYGKLQETDIDINSQEAINLMDKNMEGVNQALVKISAHSPQIVTGQYVSSRIDQIALTEISKNTIGIFENILSTRKRQIMDMDSFKNNNILREKLIGNIFSGLSALSQAPISLGKHGNKETMHKLSLAVQALVDVRKENKEADNALLEILKGELINQDTGQTYKIASLFDNQEVDIFHKAITTETRDRFKKMNHKDQMLFLLEQTNETMELGKNISLLQETFARMAEHKWDNLEIPVKPTSPTLIKFAKKSRTIAGITAAGYIAANFFRPNQLSNSLNPFDGFTDLGTDIDGNHKSFLADMELDRGVALDSIAPSFSNKSYIRMQEIIGKKYKKSRSDIISSALEDSFKNTNPLIGEWRTPPNLTYTNYTRDIGYFGSSQLNKKARY